MATKVPAFSFTGSSSKEVRDGYWYIYLLSSGTLTMTYAKTGVEVCVVGGGAGGALYDAATDRGAHGGGGGSVVNATGRALSAGSGVSVVIGSGGLAGENGNPTTAFGYTAAGGICGGGNCGLSVEDKAGTNGGDGTYAFGDASMKRYGPGGGGGGTNDVSTPGNGGADGGGKGGDGGKSGAVSAVAGEANTGAGGGGAGQDAYWTDSTGSHYYAGGAASAGGSGIVIIRGTQDDVTPVFFNGTQLTEIVFNGEKVTGLIYGGTRIFARRCVQWLLKRWETRSGFRRATLAM